MLVELFEGFGGVGGVDVAAWGGFDLHDGVDADAVADGQATGLAGVTASEFDCEGVVVVAAAGDQP